MAAATLAGARSVSTLPLPGGGNAGSVKANWGTVTVDASSEDGDIFQVCRVPANSIVIGGWLVTGDADTGIEAFDMDIGWAANGNEAADPDGFGNLGVWLGDASKVVPVGNWFPFMGVLQSVGPQLFTAETIIQVETNVAAATGAALELTVVVLYLYNDATVPAPPL